MPGLKRLAGRMLPSTAKDRLLEELGIRRLRREPKREARWDNLRAIGKDELSELFTDEVISEFWEADRPAIERATPTGVSGGVNPGDQRALYHLALGTNATNVLEIGTHIGSSAVAMGAALRRSGGSLTTVDIVDVNANSGPSPRNLVADVAGSNRVTFAVARSETFMREHPDTYDLVFIDGDHWADGVYRDIVAALESLRPDGVIVLHDYCPGGKRLWEGVPAKLGPYEAVARALHGTKASVVPLEELPWATKRGTRVTSLAVLSA